MPTEQVRRRLAGLETAIVLFSTPFLLFSSIRLELTVLALALIILGWLYAWRVFGHPLPSTPINLALLLFALMVLVSIFISADPELTQPKALGLILGFAVWRLLVVYVRKQQDVWPAVAAFTIFGLGMAGVGMVSADWRFEVDFVEQLFRLLPPQLISLPEAANDGVSRNQLGGTLLFLLPLPVSYLMDMWNRRLNVYRILLLGGLAVLLFGLLLITQSRSAWMGAIAGFVFLFACVALMSPYNWLRRLFWFSLVFAGVIFLVFLTTTWPTLVLALGETPPTSTPIGTLESLSFRFEVWRWAIQAIKDFPFTGTGLGTFRRVVLRLYPTPFTMDFAHAHNVFFQIALDLGIPGLIAYISSLVVTLLSALRAAGSDLKMRSTILGLAAGLIAFHTYGMADVLALGSKTFVIFWMSLGILTAVSNFQGR